MKVRAAISATVAAALLAAGPAGAHQRAAVTLAGPSPGIVELGGVAMAADGTGGVVYRAIADGRPHIFVVQFADGRWRAPVRVDAGQAYNSSWPRIAAAPNGRLVAAWAQESGPGSDRLFATRVDGAGARFSPPFVVDADVGEAVATFPNLALAPDGTAYLAYIAPLEPQPDSGGNLPPALPPGAAQLEYRLARIRGTSPIAYPVLNRDPSRVTPNPTAASAPRVAVDAKGAAVVAWQEPDDFGIPRVYARRLTARSIATQRQVSPAELGGRPLAAAADGFALSLAGDGEGALAWRQLPVASSVLRSARVLVSRLRGSAAFGPPTAADGLGPLDGALAAEPAAPAIGAGSDGTLGVSYSLAGTARLGLGLGGGEIAGADALGRLAGGTVPPALVSGRGGAGVTAWPVDEQGGGVAVLERPASGAPKRGLAFARLPGPVDALQAAGTDAGDAIVAFQQGRADSAQIAAVVVDAAPAAFALRDPGAWLRPATATVSWTPAPAAAGAVRYRVYVDGRAVGPATASESASIAGAVADDGAHGVRVIARDADGQETRSPLLTVRSDRTAPSVRLRASRRALRASVRDGSPGVASGVDPAATTTAWGDGTRSTGANPSHRYRHIGTYRVTVGAVDRAGNRRALSRRVEIR